MTDILFVHPNAAAKIYQDLSKSHSAIEFPIWAMMLAGFARKKGFQADLLDCEAEGLNIEEAAKRIESISPRIVCVVVFGQQPSASTQNMVGAVELMRRIKDLDLTRVYTGPHPAALPQKTVEDDPGAMACQGEGPFTLLGLLETTDHKRDDYLRKVPGLVFQNQEGIIESTPPASLLSLDADLDMLPLDFVDFGKYRTANWHSWTNSNVKTPFASIYTSLGCPFRCQFCMINAPFNRGDNKNNTFRYWQPEVVIQKLDEIASLGIKNLKIADEMFVYRKDHFLKLCDLIIARGYDFNIWCYARIDTIKEEYLEKLKKAGVNWVGLGIEAANQEVRMDVTKGKFQELNIRDIVKKVNSAGINVGGNFIFGLPQDTHQTMQETLDLALDLDLSYANFYCAMAYPGSQLHRDYSSADPLALPENAGHGWIGYSQHAFETYNLRNNQLTNKEILKFRDEAFTTYFENSKYLNSMVEKFGSSFLEEMNKMKSVKLRRKILEE